MTITLDELIDSARGVEFPPSLIGPADQIGAAVTHAIRNLGANPDDVDFVRGAIAGIVIAEGLRSTLEPAVVTWTMCQHVIHLREGLT